METLIGGWEKGGLRWCGSNLGENVMNRLVLHHTVGGEGGDFGKTKEPGMFSLTYETKVAETVYQKQQNVNSYCWQKSLSLSIVKHD